MSFYLSSKCLKQIRQSGFDDNFELIIFGDIIKCSKFTASFISTKISKLIRNDITFSQFNLDFPTQSIYYRSHEELKNKINQTNFIQSIKKLLEGDPIQIDQKNKITTAQLLIEFGIIIGNEEFITEGLKIQNLTDDTSDLTGQTAIEIIKLSKKLDNYSEISKKAFKILSQNFYSIFENIELGEIEKEDLERILSSPDLKIKSEDSLFELIHSHGPSYYFLFDYVEFQYLSRKNVELLIESIDNYDVSLHSKLWSSICRRLVLAKTEVSAQKNQRYVGKQTAEIKCENGIFENLRKSSNGNIYDLKLVDVESSKVYDGEIKSMFDKSQETRFRLENFENRYILFDFKEKEINFSKYYFSVPSSSTGWSSGRPRSWKIEGSNDKSSWELIDEKQNDGNLSGYGRSNTFCCQNINQKFYRYIRLKDLISHDNNNKFILSEIEFYGSIINK